MESVITEDLLLKNIFLQLPVETIIWKNAACTCKRWAKVVAQVKPKRRYVETVYWPAFGVGGYVGPVRMCVSPKGDIFTVHGYPFHDGQDLQQVVWSSYEHREGKIIYECTNRIMQVACKGDNILVALQRATKTEQELCEIWEMDTSGENRKLVHSPPVHFINDLVVDCFGNIYCCSFESCLIFKLSPTGDVKVFKDVGKPHQLCVDPYGNLFFISNCRVNKMSPNEKITIISDDTLPEELRIEDSFRLKKKRKVTWEPGPVCCAPDGGLYVSDSYGYRVIHIDKNGEKSAYAGAGNKGTNIGNFSPANATFSSIASLGVDSSSTLYVLTAGASPTILTAFAIVHPGELWDLTNEHEKAKKKRRKHKKEQKHKKEKKRKEKTKGESTNDD